MPRKKNGMALRRWMRRTKNAHPNAWRQGGFGSVERADRELEFEFIQRLRQFSTARVGGSYGQR
jgi:hypothetical protein